MPQLSALVVDDESTTRSLVTRALRSRGVDCDEAADGLAAESQLQQQSYSVLVTDLRIPGKNGHALCRDVINQGERPRIVVFTGVTEPRVIGDLKRRGVEQIHHKPVDYERLADDILSLFDETPRNDGPPTEKSNSKHVVALMLRDKARSERLSNLLTSSAMTTTSLHSEAEAQEMLQRERVDLLVLENDLPERSGLEFRERLFARSINPETLLLAEDTDYTHGRARKIGFVTIVNPTISDNDIADRVSKAVTEGPRRASLVAPTVARQIVEECNVVPPLPQLLVKLLEYMRLDVSDIPVKELADDISVDPKATADLMRLTNSAAMGLKHPATSVFDAVTLQGPKKAISLVLSSALVASQSELMSSWSRPLRNWYHQRSVLIAGTAAAVAERLEKVTPETAFLLGLLQDVGILILASKFDDRYTTTIDRVTRVGQLSLPMLERESFRTTHAEVSAALLEHWELPGSIIGPILHHHSSNPVRQSRIEQSFLRAMTIGEALADLHDVSHPLRLQRLNQAFAHYGDELMSECTKTVQAGITRAADACELFAIPLPDGDSIDSLVDQVQAVTAVAT